MPFLPFLPCRLRQERRRELIEERSPAKAAQGTQRRATCSENRARAAESALSTAAASFTPATIAAR